MDGKHLFGVVVRTLGLVLTLYGLYGLFYELIHFAGLLKIPLHNPPETGITFFSLYPVVGIVLLKAANRIVVFAYGRETAPEDDT